MKKRVLAGFLAVLLLTVSLFALPVPSAFAEEPEAAGESPAPESTQPPAPAEKPVLPPKPEDLPDVDVHSWEFTFCNAYNSRGWITCERGNINGIGIDARIVDAAAALMADARAEGYTIFVACAYLNTEWLTNRFLTAMWICDYDPIAATRSLLGPGINEHQTGLAIDFTDNYANNANYDIFEDPEIFDSELFAWLMEHCADYGFIYRYPADKAPWYGVACPHAHFRYVGVEAAKYIMEHDLCLEEFLSFYDPELVYLPDEGRYA